MKAWEKLLRELFEEGNRTYEYMINKKPEATKRRMLETIKQEGLTIKCVAGFLPYKDIVNKNFDTLEELFELEISNFEPKVIRGNGKKSMQIGLEEIIPFKPKVIK